MKTFKYFDNRNGGILIFECKAESILDADAKLLEEKKIQVVKCPWIGCVIAD